MQHPKAPVHIRASHALALDDAGPVKVPVGEPVARLAASEAYEAEGGLPAAGTWECTPGRWRRQVKSAEFCHFVAGHAFFEVDGGPVIELRPGDAVYFPPDTNGIWDVRETLRKTYLVI